MRKYNAVIFDFDGTVLNTLEDLTDAVNYTLTMYNFPNKTEREIRALLGNGAFALVKQSIPVGVSDEIIVKALEVYREYCMNNANPKAKVYDGMINVLNKLRYEGMVSGIVSNKSDRILQKLYGEHFRGLFDFVIGENDGMPRKPAPDMLLHAMVSLSTTPKTTIYVGDTVVDFMTAKNAGVDFVGVSWGFNDKEVLIDAGAEIVIDEPAELLDIVTDSKWGEFSKK